MLAFVCSILIGENGGMLTYSRQLLKDFLPQYRKNLTFFFYYHVKISQFGLNPAILMLKCRMDVSLA